MINETGPAHAKVYEIKCSLTDANGVDLETYTGTGSSISNAKRNAAEVAWAQTKLEKPPPPLPSTPSAGAAGGGGGVGGQQQRQFHNKQQFNQFGRNQGGFNRGGWCITTLEKQTNTDSTIKRGGLLLLIGVYIYI